jgi:hypothetical protein
MRRAIPFSHGWFLLATILHALITIALCGVRFDPGMGSFTFGEATDNIVLRIFQWIWTPIAMAVRNSATDPTDGLPAFVGLLWSCAFGAVAALMAPHFCRPVNRYRDEPPAPPWKNQDGDTHNFTGH